MCTKYTNGDRLPLQLKRIIFDDGESLAACFFSEYALPVPGFIPIKLDLESTNTVYINSEKILGIVVADTEQEKMRTDLITPKEIKKRG